MCGDSHASSGYADCYTSASHGYKEIGPNGWWSFEEPREYRVDIGTCPETFYVGIQMYYRGNVAYTRDFNFYDIILVE